MVEHQLESKTVDHPPVGARVQEYALPKTEQKDREKTEEERQHEDADASAGAGRALGRIREPPVAVGAASAEKAIVLSDASVVAQTQESGIALEELLNSVKRRHRGGYVLGALEVFQVTCVRRCIPSWQRLENTNVSKRGASVQSAIRTLWARYAS